MKGMELRGFKIFLVLALLGLILVSCSPATPIEQPTLVPTIVTTSAPTVTIADTPTASRTGLPQTEADVPRVAVQDAAAAIQSGEAVVVDVRSAEAYQESHIPGALSIPLFEIEKDPTGVKLDKDKWIITYCT